LKIDGSFYGISSNTVESHIEKDTIKEILQENTIESHQISFEDNLKQLEISKNSFFQNVIVKLLQT